MDRSNIEKIASNPDDRLLLAKLWDKINIGIRKNISANTCFLSLREQELAQFLFGQCDGLYAFGGYPNAERKMLIFLPEYIDESALMDTDSPIVCLRTTYYEKDTLTHRDILGALIGIGIGRETIGDICVGKGSCDFLVTSEIAPYVLQNLISAGRTKLHLEQISLDQLTVQIPETKEIRDTLASLRLDSVLSSGFQISRSLAANYIGSGKVAVDGKLCEKADKMIPVGATISLRGQGKIKLASIHGKTKKDRISVIIQRYI